MNILIGWCTLNNVKGICNEWIGENGDLLLLWLGGFSYIIWILEYMFFTFWLTGWVTSCFSVWIIIFVWFFSSRTSCPSSNSNDDSLNNYIFYQSSSLASLLLVMFYKFTTQNRKKSVNTKLILPEPFFLLL